MKHTLKRIFSLLLALGLAYALAASGFCEESAAAGASPLPITLVSHRVNGPEEAIPGSEERVSSSFVSYPELTTEDADFAPAVEKVNQAIQEKARISEYTALLSTLTAGGVGLRMDYRATITGYADSELHAFQVTEPYLSLLFSAEGKMLWGRPSQVYYPMTFNLATGEEVPFDALFSDPEGAKAYIENALEAEVEPALSTYLENSQLFPVPFERFYLDSTGHILLYYENSQLSFLSGMSGAVCFQYSELWPWLNLAEDGVIPQLPYYRFVLSKSPEERGEQLWQFLRSGTLLMGDTTLRVHQRFSDFETMPVHFTTDSGFYPGGAYLEAEEACFRGALILTDEDEDLITGFLTSRADLMGLVAGKTSLEEAVSLLGRGPDAELALDETAAERYKVCPGTAAIYQFEGYDGPLGLTLYADEASLVQFIELSAP